MTDDHLPLAEEGRHILTEEVLGQCWALTRKTADREEFNRVLRIWGAISWQVFEAQANDPKDNHLRQDIETSRTAVRKLLNAPMLESVTSSSAEANFIQNYLRLETGQDALSNLRVQALEVDEKLRALEQFLISRIKIGAPTRQLEKELFAIQLAHIWAELSGLRSYGEPFHQFVDLLFSAALNDTKNMDRIVKNAIEKFRKGDGSGFVHLSYLRNKGRKSEI